MITALILLGILIGVSLLPIGVRASYDTDGALLQLMIGPFFYKLYPGKSVSKKKKAKTTKVNSNNSTFKGSKNSGGNLNDLIPILRVVWDLLSDAKRKLRVKRLELRLVLAGDDPCDLSVNYGRAWAALGNLMPRLESVLTICNRNLEIECDYMAEQTTVYLLIDLTMTVGRFFSLVMCHGLRGLKEYRKLVKMRKGGA